MEDKCSATSWKLCCWAREEEGTSTRHGHGYKVVQCVWGQRRRCTTCLHWQSPVLTRWRAAALRLRSVVLHMRVLLKLFNFLIYSCCLGKKEQKLTWLMLFMFIFYCLWYSPLCWSDGETDLSGLSAKKRRVETFRQKEKRKRDLGQATSDKNFVEEEKRILRQKADWPWILFDVFSSAATSTHIWKVVYCVLTNLSIIQSKVLHCSMVQYCTGVLRTPNYKEPCLCWQIISCFLKVYQHFWKEIFVFSQQCRTDVLGWDLQCVHCILFVCYFYWPDMKEVPHKHGWWSC